MPTNDHADQGKTLQSTSTGGTGTESSWARLVDSRTLIPEELLAGTDIPLVFNAIEGYHQNA